MELSNLKSISNHEEKNIKTRVDKKRVYWIETIEGKLERREKIVAVIDIGDTPKTMGTKKILGIICDYTKWCEIVYDVAEDCSRKASMLSSTLVKVSQVAVLITSILSTPTVHAFAVENGATSVTKSLTDIFNILMEIALSIGEPILWFYALTALIMMATGKNKNIGLNRLKSVFYSYIMVRMLPTFFMFLGWLTEVMQKSFQEAIKEGNIIQQGVTSLIKFGRGGL